MKTIAGLGKLLATLFWCVVLVNLVIPYAQPFTQLLTLAGFAVLALHVFELLLFRREISAQPNGTFARAQVLAFGIFHLWTIPGIAATSLQAEEMAHA